MLSTPGCWACEEMGALLAGVFCGVLDEIKQRSVLATFSLIVAGKRGVSSRRSSSGVGKGTHGATGRSGRLFRMGSAIVDVFVARLWGLEAELMKGKGY